MFLTAKELEYGLRLKAVYICQLPAQEHQSQGLSVLEMLMHLKRLQVRIGEDIVQCMHAFQVNPSVSCLSVFDFGLSRKCLKCESIHCRFPEDNVKGCKISSGLRTFEM